MSRTLMFALYFVAIFLQAGAYGLTFMLPRLFDSFGASEKTVGQMLFVTAIVTLITVYYSGHLSDLFGRLRTLALACFAIAAALFFYGKVQSVGLVLVTASILLGFGWGLTYSLTPIVLTRLVEADERVRFFTLLSVFLMAGFGLSPVLAAVLESAFNSTRSAFFVLSACCVVSALLFFVLRAPIQKYALNSGPEASSRITLLSLASVFSSKALVPVIMGCLGGSVFAGLINFQTVFADTRGLPYANFFLAYTITVVICRLILAKFKGGKNPYKTIAILQYVMCASVVLFIFSGENLSLYFLTAILFGIGYGVSYPILVAVASADAQEDLGPQTLQLFALSYFVGIFGFPLIAGWIIVEIGVTPLLAIVATIAALEASMALRRAVKARSE